MLVNILISMVIRKFVHYIISSKYHGFRTGENGPAALVLAGPVFLKVKKIEVRFYKKEVIKKSASVIFGLARLILLSYNGWRRHTKRSKIIGRSRIMLARYSVVQKIQVIITVIMWFLNLLGL